MRTLRKTFNKSAVALALSIAAMPGLVNARARSLTPVNKSPDKARVAQLIEVILNSGADGNISSTLAPVIGLPKAMPIKKQVIVTSESGNDFEQRAFFVVYENIESAVPEPGNKRAVCAYVLRVKRSGLDNQVRYFRIDLNGKLEKVVLSQSKADANGKPVRGSGVKFDQDINSPEVRKTFEAEMKFWLNDWLKKQQKTSAKKAA